MTKQDRHTRTDAAKTTTKEEVERPSAARVLNKFKPSNRPMPNATGPRPR